MEISAIQKNHVNSNTMLKHDRKADLNQKESSNPNDMIIEALEKQKEALNEHIQRIKGMDMDEKVKRDTINELHKQVSQIESRIAEVKSQKLTSQQEKENKNAPMCGTNHEDSDKSVEINNLTKLINNVSELKKMNEIKAGMKQQVNVILSEPDPVRGTYSKFQTDTMDKLSENMAKIDKKIKEKVKEINNHLKEEKSVNKDKNNCCDENENVDTYV